jgi:transposase InsO family protein
MYDFITEDRAEAGMADPPSLQTYCDALGISASGYRKHCLRQVTVSQREIDHMMQQQFHHDIQSMSSTGNCYDNAVAESYFKTIKSEEIYWKHYRTRDEARTSIADYIDYYNNERLHSSIGYNTPRECRELKSRNQLSITNHPIDTTLLKG